MTGLELKTGHGGPAYTAQQYQLVVNELKTHHRGEGNAITWGELGRILGMTDRATRRAAKTLELPRSAGTGSTTHRWWCCSTTLKPSSTRCADWARSKHRRPAVRGAVRRAQGRELATEGEMIYRRQDVKLAHLIEIAEKGLSLSVRLGGFYRSRTLDRLDDDELAALQKRIQRERARRREE